MKKTFLAALAAGILSSVSLAEALKVGATPIPHAEILEFIKPELKNAGYELEIVEFNDYVFPNLSLEDGDLDANFIQHKPYLDEFNKNKGTNLTATTGVHLEPMGVYSSKIKSLSELKDGDLVAIPNDPTNESRALDVLASQGLIELDNAPLKTPLNITKNPKNLKFKELEGPMLPRSLDDVTISVINTNFAMNANLNPTNDAIAIESSKSPYVNFIVVRTSDIESPKTKALDAALKTENVKKFIAEKYKGAIVPGF